MGAFRTPIALLLTTIPIIAFAQDPVCFSDAVTQPSRRSAWMPEAFSREGVLQTVLLGTTLSLWVSKQDTRARDVFKSDGRWGIGIPAYVLASMTAVARMEDHRHFASDVVAGAFLGVIIGKLVTPADHNRGFPVRICTDSKHAGLQIVC